MSKRRQRPRRQRQSEPGHRARSVGTALQGHAAVMPGRDLTTQDQADAGPTGLGRVEGDEQVLRVADAGTVIDDPELTLALVQVAAQLHSGSPGWTGFHGVLDQVDQRLLEVDRVAEATRVRGIFP